MRPQTGAILRGKRFLVTRPEGQAAALIEGIRELGGDVTHIPFLAIEPVSDQTDLLRIAGRLIEYRACLFVSANAARIAWPLLSRNAWPQNVVGATVGPGTAQVLKTLGISQVVMPASHFDSEGLLSEPFFEADHCRGQRFALIRGEGGRDFLAQTLRTYGALVDEAAVYRRGLHPEALARLSAWLDAEAWHAPGTLLISSSESLERVMSAADPGMTTRLQSLNVLVPHRRIAETANRLGFEHVATSAGGDEGLLDFLHSYNGISKTTINDETGPS